ncbi:MAG: hypothetical protein HY901_33640 [Deltaproteobacteria bacterium]|nr:hypothetical protein [Deltaproteobacteria bacterium]
MPRQTERAWNALEIWSRGVDIGEIAAVLKALPKGRIDSLVVHYPEPLLADFHRTLSRAVEILGPLKHLQLPEIRVT